MQINLKTVREEIDKSYVHFPPNTDAIKPVHIAGGLLRAIYGKYNNTKRIKQMAIVDSGKGKIPEGNEIDKVYDWLIKSKKIENIELGQIETLRKVMQRLLSVDDGVYAADKLSSIKMTSYSAGSKYFLTPHSIHEDAGEFIGILIKQFCPKLADHIRIILESDNDPITTLFGPIIEENMVEFADSSRTGEKIKDPGKIDYKKYKEFAESIRISGECLLGNIKDNKNPLFQLRIFNLFCIFNLIRYMTLLETFYCGENIKPILLDFTGKNPSDSSVARSSEMSYTQIHKSINRFYAWGYAQWLKDNYEISDLMSSQTPIYDSKSPEELKIKWELTKKEASDLYINDSENSEKIYDIFGDAIYDMVTWVATSNPVSYLRAIGTKSGILYPPDKSHPNKRFVISQDVIEMLVKSCVEHGKAISRSDIIESLWNRFGIVIGGSQSEINKLKSNAMILQINEKALDENFTSFTKILQAMDFAEIMADGILQIRI